MGFRGLDCFFLVWAPARSESCAWQGSRLRPRSPCLCWDSTVLYSTQYCTVQVHNSPSLSPHPTQPPPPIDSSLYHVPVKCKWLCHFLLLLFSSRIVCHVGKYNVLVFFRLNITNDDITIDDIADRTNSNSTLSGPSFNPPVPSQTRPWLLYCKVLLQQGDLIMPKDTDLPTATRRPQKDAGHAQRTD